jgi:hypothetical protein
MLGRVDVERSFPCPGLYARAKDAGLWATAVTYSTDAESLFRYPQYATSVTTRQVQADSAQGDIVIEVPSFGSATKAVVLVVTVGDGPLGFYSRQRQVDVPDLLPIRVTLGLSKNGFAAVPKVRLDATATGIASRPRWSPNGGSITFAATPISPGDPSQIYWGEVASPGTIYPVAPSSANQFTPDWSPD